ncbi:unnamed protein product [Closterium sp. Yama58-4]|nr:unnamed protein product [Closterium sp. Yama58-4]
MNLSRPSIELGAFPCFLVVAATVSLLGCLLSPCSAVHHVAQPAGRPNTKQYIVHLTSVPSVLSYRGGVSGLRATATVDDNEDEYDEDENEDNEDSQEDGGSIAGDKAPMASGATSAVLTVQQLSARAARIMRSTPWGRLTRPDVRLPHVQAFTRFLEASHRSLLQSLGIPSSAIFHSYTYLMNSFAAQLTGAEVKKLKRHPAVAEVERDRTVRVTSVHSPEFLKLDSSLWPANGGQSNAGEGVIIGVIDSGIWPENPSFSNPDPNGVPYSSVPVRWRGVCSKTDDFTACNGKVVGARFFIKGAERNFGKIDISTEYRSARDMLQHGTWCAGVMKIPHLLPSFPSHPSFPLRGAAGNAGVEVTTGGRTFGTASGMAPRARLAVYKGLWIVGEYEGVGSGSDLIAAAEKAVADGVDVISCSWGGLAMYFQDLPYLRGLKAGVVTAFAAGNEGRPNPMSIWGTLSSASPFYLTVGASTMGRKYTAEFTLGDGTTFTGYSLGGTAATASPLPLMLAGDAASPPEATGAVSFLSGWHARLVNAAPCARLVNAAPCARLVNAAPCARLVNAAPCARLVNAAPCARLVNAAPCARLETATRCCYLTQRRHLLLAEMPQIPERYGASVDEVLMWADTLGAAAILVISEAAEYDAAPIFSYSKTPSIVLSPTATLSAFTVSHSSNAPQLAYFSSTGPPRSPIYPPALLMRDFPTNDILKPDIIGPGYQLWAAAPGKSLETAATDPPEFNYYSGTSMSTPHLAGIMALIVQSKPSWSPSQVISAITTTAYTRNENGQPIQRANGKKANAWDYGGGHVDPTRVLDPGLTFHAAHKHFVNFLMMRDPIRTKKRFWRMGKAHPIFAWNLNRASIAVTRLHGALAFGGI